jgi:WD40 repeat protein
LELKSDKVIFEKRFEDNVNYVDTTNDGRKVIISLSAVDLIVDIEEGKTIEFKKQFGKFGFRLDKDQTAIIGILDNERFAWIDLASGEVLKSKKFEKSTIKSWRVSQDNSLAVFAADSRKLYLKNLGDSGLESEIDPPCGNVLISLIEISKSGEYAIFGCDTKVYRQNLRDFAAKPELILEFNTNVWSIAISPDDSWIAAGSMSGEWYVQNDQTKKQYPANELDSLRKGFKFETTVNALAFSADSKFLIAGTENGTAKAFSIEDGDFVESIKAGGQILSAGFINLTNKIFLGSIDGILRTQAIHSPLFAFDVGQRVETIAVVKDLVGVGTSPKANDLSDSAAGASVFNLKNLEFLGKIPTSKKVNSISFDPGGTRVLTASEDGTAKITLISDIANPLMIGAAHRKPGRPVRVAAFSADGSGMTIVSSKKAQAYRLDQYEDPFVTMEATDWVSAAHFSSDNKYISTAAADRMARIYDSADGRVVASYTAKNWIWDADLTPDLSKFVNLNWDNELVIQTTERDDNGHIIGLKDTSKVELPNGGEFMALSPNSYWAAVSLWNGQAFMVNLKEGFSYEMKCLPATQALKPVFSADSRFVAFGQGNAAMVYHVSDGRPVQRAYHADRVTSVAFHDGRLVSGAWDGKVRITEIDDEAVVDCTSQ